MKAIMFDMGETLVHNLNFSFKNGLTKLYSQAINPKCLVEDILEYFDLLYSEAFSVREKIEISFLDVIRLFQCRFDLQFTKSYQEIEEEVANCVYQVELVDNVVEFLEYCYHKGYPMIVLSNSTFSSITISKQLGSLQKYFKKIISSGDHVVRKPGKSFFELGKSYLEGYEVVYIGNDYYFDIFGANNAKIPAVWFNESKKAKGNNVTSDYIEISSYLELIKQNF